LGEKLFRPLEKEILYDTRERDIVGRLRQLDVGVIDSTSGENRVKALVEVQKRKSKVDLEDFGNWIYKRKTLQAQELIIVSEKGFTTSVVEHVKKLHSENVKLGILHEVDTGFIEQVDSTCLGITRILDQWWFASIFVQYGDADEVATVELGQLPNTEENIFGQESPMSLIRFVEKQQGERPSGLNLFSNRGWSIILWKTH
jgi:hypothetical protein